MRMAGISAGTVAVLCLALAPAFGGQKGKGGGAPTTHGNPHTTTGPTTTTHGNPHTTTGTATTTKTHGNPHTATAPTTGTTTTTLNPIAAKLQGKPLGTRLEQMLLSSGMTLNNASDGFRNQGQFIAAVHVSHNLGIPFAALKAAMLGTTLAPTTTTGTSTTTTPLSLGQAIQKLQPTANATTEAARAETQATTDLKTTTTTPTTTKKHGRK